MLASTVILFCHFSKRLKIVFENDNLAIFAGNSQKDICPPPPPLISCGAFLTAKITNLADIYFFPNFNVLPFQCFGTFLILFFCKRSADV